MTILTQNITITVPKFMFQRHLQGQVQFNLSAFVHPYANRPNICMQTTRVSRVHVQVLVVNKYFAVSQCAHAWQIENLAETHFLEIFGRAKQILPVQCVRTVIPPLFLHRIFWLFCLQIPWLSKFQYGVWKAMTGMKQWWRNELKHGKRCENSLLVQTWLLT